MNDKKVLDRLTFLAKTFDVFECDNDAITIKVNELKEDGYSPSIVNNNNGLVIAIISTKDNERERTLKKISISSEVFTNMIIADPTNNKMCLQWMLNLFTQYVKLGTITSLDSAIRFVEEDLPQANNYLRLFEDNKRKQKFKVLCNGSYILKGVSDPTNINQYKSLTQLFDAVDPFIEKEPSSVERTMLKFVESGKALIPVRDRNYMVYIPKTLESSVIFNNYASWCTAVPGNGNFKNYTQGFRKPNGKESDIYIIINNKFFTGESDEIYQIHFESNQLKDRKNGSNVSIFENVLSISDGITNYFYDELIGMAKINPIVSDNIYIKYLIKFGFSESLFDLYDDETSGILIDTYEVPRLPDLSRFKRIDNMIITDAGLVELHPSIGGLSKLKMLILTGNKLKSLPREISNLKNLIFLNIKNNQVNEFPDDIKYLDKSNGGALVRIALDKDKIGLDNYKKLVKLLPTTELG